MIVESWNGKIPPYLDVLYTDGRSLRDRSIKLLIGFESELLHIGMERVETICEAHCGYVGLHIEVLVRVATTLRHPRYQRARRRVPECTIELLIIR